MSRTSPTSSASPPRRDPDTFLYKTAPITSLSSPAWNSKQFYSVTRIDSSGEHRLGSNLPCPPCNIGPLSTPGYATALAQPAVNTLTDGSKVFAGQRAEGFYLDLGSIFDLGNLRPFQNYNVFAKAEGQKAAPGVRVSARRRRPAGTRPGAVAHRGSS